MRLILGILSLAACTFVGYALSKKYSDRKRFYDSFRQFNKRLINEVSFTQASILKCLNERADDDFTAWLTEYYRSFSPLEKNYLKEEEKNFAVRYAETIGKSDKNSQLAYLKGVEKQVEENLREATENEKKYRTAYIKLGVLAGLIILIILL